jgi:hypothetical protein
MIAPGGLLLVVSYLFAVFVLWVELEKKYITKLEFEKYFAGPHTEAPFTLWCGTVTIEILRALKEHPKAVPWKFSNYLHVDLNCTLK